MSSAFSLIEVIVVVLILAVLSVLTVPIYVSFTDRAAMTAAEGDLLRCAANIERRLLDEGTLGLLADSDLDGVGDAVTGEVAGEVCRASARGYRVEVVQASDDFFLLHAVPEEESGGLLLGYDAFGNTLIDRNADGDFDDAEEQIW